MKRKLFGSLSALLAGTSLAFAQAPDPFGANATGPGLAPPAGAAGPAAGSPYAGWNPSPYAPNPAAAVPAGVAPYPGGTGSPYWPNPAGKDVCGAPGCAPLPATPLQHDDGPNCGEWIWADAEYL